MCKLKLHVSHSTLPTIAYLHHAGGAVVGLVATWRAYAGTFSRLTIARAPALAESLWVWDDQLAPIDPAVPGPARVPRSAVSYWLLHWIHR